MTRRLLALALGWACCTAPVLAADLDSFTTEEQVSTFCQSLWRFAKAVATERDKGTSEDEMLERLEGMLAEKRDMGYKTKHVMRTTLKGAYLASEKSPSRYAAGVQTDCMSNFTRR